MLDFLRRMVPPDWSVLRHATTGAIQTVEIALVGTGAAALLALPMGFAAARNAAPPWLFYGARIALNVFRGWTPSSTPSSSWPPSASGRSPACWPWSRTPRRCWPSSTRKRSRPSTPVPSRPCARRGRGRSRCSAGAFSPSSCRSSSRSRSTGSRPISGPRPSSASSGRAASASTSRTTCGRSTTRRRRPCCSS